MQARVDRPEVAVAAGPSPDAAATKPSTPERGLSGQHTASRARHARATAAQRDAKPSRAWTIALVTVALLALMSYGGRGDDLVGVATCAS